MAHILCFLLYFCTFSLYMCVCLCFSTYTIVKVYCIEISNDINQTIFFQSQSKRRENGSKSTGRILQGGGEVGRSSLHAHRCQQSFSICHFARWTTFDERQKNGFSNYRFLIIFVKGLPFNASPAALGPSFKRYSCQPVFSLFDNCGTTAMRLCLKFPC